MMGSEEPNPSSVIKITRHNHRDEFYFLRSELFHQMLMEDFNFLDAARSFVGNHEPPAFNYSDVSTIDNFRKASLAYPNGLIEFDHFTHRSPSRIFNNLNMNPDIRSLKFQARSSIWPPLSIWAHWLLHTTVYAFLMVLIITVNSVTIAVDQELDNSEDSQRFRIFLEAGDFFFLCLFVAEIILKFLDDFGGFWSEGWNVFDFLITATSLAAPVLDLAFPNSEENDDLEPVLTAVKYLRIIRIFRSLNVVTRIHKIQLIWGAVVKTFQAMIYITALMSIFFYIFAIIGIQAFDRYTHSHLPQLRYRLAFSNLHNAFVTLFQIFTLDQWYDVIEDTAIVMGYPLACTYILIWILLGSFIFRNIFVGVMVNNFQNIRQSLIEQSSQGTGMGRRSANVNIFALDALENEGLLSDDVLVDWEAEIFHSLELIRALENEMSPVFWPRDTMFQYYMLLEAYASNLDERAHLMHLLDKAVLHFMDP
ncbi:Cation channel sperm-associated protein 2 [Orchesella cincta]|uniref:Cation channel sperm-associated protein 2 n=1 Tax=Orchesella cincta TaxID=48709 RepID=A0A1D2MY29_ORCCI|nr:Cation channel sperm-associated protein 2 [Orchesella cincta]